MKPWNLPLPLITLSSLPMFIRPVLFTPPFRQLVSHSFPSRLPKLHAVLPILTIRASGDVGVAEPNIIKNVVNKIKLSIENEIQIESAIILWLMLMHEPSKQFFFN